MVTVLGHRGAIVASGQPYQNTLAAFKLALTYGDGFETDACLTADGHVVLAHSEKYTPKSVVYALTEHLDPASAAQLGTRHLDDLTLAEVRHLRLANGATIPTLPEALAMVAAAPGKIINLELKSYGVEAAVVPLLHDAFTNTALKPTQVIVSSFNHAALLAVRAAFPDLALGLLCVQPDEAGMPLFPWRADSTAAYQALTPALLDSAPVQHIAPQYVILPNTALPLDVELLAKHGLYAMIWVYTERADYNPQAFRAALNPLGDRLAGVIVDDVEAFG